MRVFHVQKATGIGGSERHLLTLLSALAGRGVESRMCVLAAGDYDRFVGALRSAGIDTVVVPAGGDMDPRTTYRVLRELRAFGADLVHTHLIHGDTHGQLAARIAGVPGVSSVHATHDFYTQQPYRVASKLAARSARRVIAISNYVRSFLLDISLVRTDAIRVVHYGLDVGAWSCDPASRGTVRSRWGAGDDVVVIGVASRLVPHKGHDFLLAAFAKVWERDPALRLVIAGDGPLRRELESLASTLSAAEAVHFLGYVAEIETFMNACDVLVFPTLPGFGEGFGLAALEAMAAGRPVVATRLDSLPEIVVEAETGYLVTPGAVDELVDALSTLASDRELRLRLGSAARARAEERFSIDAMVRKTLAVYAEAT